MAIKLPIEHGSAAAHNRRDESRRTIAITLPLSIVEAGSGEALACRLEDVSPDGIGVIVDRKIAKGTRLEFVTLRTRFALEVAWCDATEQGNGFRCGLRLANPEQNLYGMFSKFFGLDEQR